MSATRGTRAARRVGRVASLLAFLGLVATPPARAAEAGWHDWRDAWALAEHFDLSLVARDLASAERFDAAPDGALAVTGEDEQRVVIEHEAADPPTAPPGAAAEPLPGEIARAWLGRRTAGFPAATWRAWLVAVAPDEASTGGVLRLPGGDARRAEWLVQARADPSRRILDLTLARTGLLLLVDDAALGRAVLEVSYRPGSEYPWRIGHEPLVRTRSDAAGHAVMAEHGCFACHSLHGRRQVGPALDPGELADRLAARLDSREYAARVAHLDGIDAWATRRWRDARAQVMAARGAGRVRTWLHWHLVEPSFDDPQARMPSVDLDASEIEAISGFLLRDLAPE